MNHNDPEQGVLDSLDLAAKWYERAASTQHGHYLAALHYSRLNYWLGIPVIILTAGVGTSVFASLQQQADQPSETVTWFKVAVGLASVSATVLAALQTFLGYGDKAEKHRVAGAKYGAVGRELEGLLTLRHPPMETLEKIKLKLDALAQESVNIPFHIFGTMEKIPVRYIWNSKSEKDRSQQ